MLSSLIIGTKARGRSEMENVDSRDHPDFCDAHIGYAELNGQPLCEDELKLVNKECRKLLNVLSRRNRTGKPKIRANYKITKPVFLISHGPSVSELERNIGLFRDYDVHWAGFNRFSHTERQVLGRIGKRFDILYCTSTSRFKEEQEALRLFMRRLEDNVLITDDRCLRSDRHLPTTGRYITHASQRIGGVANWVPEGYSSLMSYLFALIELGAKTIVLFGCDGGSNTSDKMYYGQEEYFGENFSDRQSSIDSDTKKMNRDFYSMKPKTECEIININSSSSYNCFKQKSFEWLVEERNAFLSAAVEAVWTTLDPLPILSKSPIQPYITREHGIQALQNVDTWDFKTVINGKEVISLDLEAIRKEQEVVPVAAWRTKETAKAAEQRAAEQRAIHYDETEWTDDSIRKSMKHKIRKEQEVVPVAAWRTTAKNREEAQNRAEQEYALFRQALRQKGSP